MQFDAEKRAQIEIARTKLWQEHRELMATLGEEAEAIVQSLYAPYAEDMKRLPEHAFVYAKGVLAWGAGIGHVPQDVLLFKNPVQIFATEAKTMYSRHDLKVNGDAWCYFLDFHNNRKECKKHPLHGVVSQAVKAYEKTLKKVCALAM